jgi:hypothetical protein
MHEYGRDVQVSAEGQMQLRGTWTLKGSKDIRGVRRTEASAEQCADLAPTFLHARLRSREDMLPKIREQVCDQSLPTSVT